MSVADSYKMIIGYSYREYIDKLTDPTVNYEVRIMQFIKERINCRFTEELNILTDEDVPSDPDFDRIRELNIIEKYEYSKNDTLFFYSSDGVNPEFCLRITDYMKMLIFEKRM